MMNSRTSTNLTTCWNPINLSLYTYRNTLSREKSKEVHPPNRELGREELLAQLHNQLKHQPSSSPLSKTGDLRSGRRQENPDRWRVCLSTPRFLQSCIMAQCGFVVESGCSHATSLQFCGEKLRFLPLHSHSAMNHFIPSCSLRTYVLTGR